MKGSPRQEVVQALETWRSETEGTYSCLRETLNKFSIFSGKNPLVNVYSAFPLSYLFEVVQALNWDMEEWDRGNLQLSEGDSKQVQHLQWQEPSGECIYSAFPLSYLFSSCVVNYIYCIFHAGPRCSGSQWSWSLCIPWTSCYRDDMLLLICKCAWIWWYFNPISGPSTNQVTLEELAKKHGLTDQQLNCENRWL